VTGICRISGTNPSGMSWNKGCKTFSHFLSVKIKLTRYTASIFEHTLNIIPYHIQQLPSIFW